MGTCYSVHGKGESQPYITVKPLSRDSPILQGGDAELSSHSSSPVKGLGDLELPAKSVLKNSANWSQNSSPIFEKKVHRQVSFDLMSEMVLPSSESSPLKPNVQEREREGPVTNSNGIGEQNKEGELRQGLLLKSSGVMNLSQDELSAPNSGVDLVQRTANGEMSDATPDLLRNTVPLSQSPAIPPSSQLQTIEVVMELVKQPGKTLGFSIAGGRGSTPAYEDVDESIFVTKIAPGGLAEADGRLRLGDKLLQVNDVDMVNATHAEAVAALKSVIDVCRLIVSREVLVVMPEDLQGAEGAEGVEGAMEPPSDLPSPVAKLNFTEGEEGEEKREEQTEAQQQDKNGESFAKKIVSDILDRSVDRYMAESVGSAAMPEAEAAAETTSPSSEDQAEDEDKPPHDNYVNFDVAKTVLEANARKEAQVTERADSLPPMPMMVNGFDHRPLERNSSTYSDFDDEEEDYPKERVLLDRSIGKLGLSIAGGADHVSHVFGQGRPGIYISKITKGGAAEATGKLRLGDRILEVNNHNVRFANHQQAVQLLISQLGNIELLVQHVPQPPGLQMVVLEKEPDAKLGISIRGGGKGSKGNPLDKNDEGIFISKIAVGGAADKDSRLKVGHRILEVNGISLLGSSHLDAVKALRSSPDSISITVCQGFDPKEILRRKMEAEAAANGRAEKIPLSAASSLALDDALNRLLSESMDSLDLPQKSQSAIAPAGYAVGIPRHMISRSSMDITVSTDGGGDKPVTPDELDELLKGLTSFGDVDYGKVEANGNGRKAAVKKISPLAQERIALSDIINPLQQGIFSKDSSELSLVEDESPTPVRRDSVEEKGEELVGGAEEKSPEQSELEEELAPVEVEDTSSFLETLDNEVSMMQDEVSQRESEIDKEKDDEETPKVRRKSTRTHLKVDHTPVKMPSPETRRRAESMKKIEVPNMKASAAAVKSIIGEVFADVSFEEFERGSSTPRSGLSSGGITPDLRSISPDSEPDTMKNLLSALHNISGSSEEPVQEQATKASGGSGEVYSAPVVEVKEEEKIEEQPPRERSNTLPSAEPTPVEEVAGGVMLRVPTGPKQSPEKRKSAPPKVPEKPTTFVSPEKLSFHEKLALHKKVADSNAAPVAPSTPTRPKSGSDASRQQRPLSTIVIAEEPESTLKRTFSEGEMESEATVEVTSPVRLSERIASFQASQTKAGMAPVEIHPRRMSEEQRLARRTGSTSDDSEVASTSDLHVNRDSTPTYVLESGPSDPYISDSQDTSGVIAASASGDHEQPLVSVTINTNSNNNNNSGKFVTTTSLYVAAVPSDVSSPRDDEGDERASKHGVEERGETTAQEKQDGTDRVDVLHNAANSTLSDSDTNESTNNSCSIANPTPNVQPSDLL